MSISKDSFGLRYIISTLVIVSLIIGLVAHNTYSQDLKEHFFQKIIKLLPDMENRLAAL